MQPSRAHFFCINLKSGHYVPTSRLQALNALSRFRVLQRAHSGSAEFSGHAITARSRPHVQIHVAFCAKPIPLFHSVGANACLSDENQARHEKSDARSFCSVARRKLYLFAEDNCRVRNVIGGSRSQLKRPHTSPG